MTVYTQFGIFFLQLVFAASEIIAGALLMREALRRRGQRHLILFSVFFLIVGVGALLWFFGGFFSAQGFDGIGRALVAVFPIFTVIGSFFLACAFIQMYVAGIWKKLLLAAALILAVLALAVGEEQATEAFGIYIAAGNARSFATSYSYWALTNAVGAVLSFRACRRSKHDGKTMCGADRFLLVGCLLTIVAGLTSYLFIGADLWGGVIITYTLFILSVTYKYLGANSKNHPDQGVARHPENAVRGTLMGKVLLVSALFFALMTFVLLASTSNFFIRQSLTDQDERIRMEISHAAKEIRGDLDTMRFDAVVLAQRGESLAALAGDSAAFGRLSESLSIRSADASLTVADTRGSVIIRSGRDDRTQSLSGSLVMERALGGRADAAIEWDDVIGTWVIRGASAIRDEAGATRGVLMISRPLLGWSFLSCPLGQVMPISGCGFVSRSGEIVSASGVVPDAVTLERFRSSAAANAGIGSGNTDEIYRFVVHHVSSVAGESDGFMYIYITQAGIEADIIRFLSAVIVVTALFLFIALVLLAFGMALLLRPLLMLKGVADRVAGGDYGISVDYSSPDEIGRLAAAFNRMSLTIRDRTRSLNERMREQSDFLSHTVKEIRGPLNIFRWTLEMLRFGDVGKLTDEQMELLEQMNQTNERVNIMVNDLLSVSRMDKGVLKLARGPVAMEDVIDDVAGELTMKIREKKIDFYWKRPDEPLPKVLADGRRLVQILSNLIGNAVKFTDMGGHVFVSVSEADDSGPAGRRGKFVHVQVEDNGRGIPEEQHNLVFSRFFRARNVLGEEIEGTGLGLYIAKCLVDMHGGEMWFESEENAGSKFHFTIPVADEGGSGASS